jgi:hypothetical protein
VGTTATRWWRHCWNFDRDDLIRFERDGQRLTGPELRTATAEYIDEIPLRLAAMKLFRGNNHTEAGGAP